MNTEQVRKKLEQMASDEISDEISEKSNSDKTEKDENFREKFGISTLIAISFLASVSIYYVVIYIYEALQYLSLKL